MTEGQFKIKTYFHNGTYCEYHIETTKINEIIDCAIRNGFVVVNDSDILMTLRKQGEMFLNVYKRKNAVKIISKIQTFVSNWKQITTF